MSKIKKFFCVIAGAIIVMMIKVGNVFAEIQIPNPGLYGIPRAEKTPDTVIALRFIGIFICIPIIIFGGIIALVKYIRKTKKNKQQVQQSVNQNANPHTEMKQNQNVDEKQNTNVENNENKQG